MYLDSSRVTINGKTYTRHLLRENYRENGKVKHRTIANISNASPAEIEAIRLALRHKDELQDLGTVRQDVSLRQGPSVGAVAVVQQVAERLGMANALGSSRQGKLALWQVIARVINQGSRLAAVRLATSHAACDLLDLKAFDEDDLYDNLDWLAENQTDIENRLFARDLSAQAKEGSVPGRTLYLYDVTSVYLEGTQNHFAAFGYNRDGKKGKRQIVIGLLENEWGKPLSIEVFKGNTTDPKTVGPQIHKLADRFGGGPVVFVGDRGMIKSQQIKELQGEGFHYLTAITKPQIEALLKRGAIQMDLFDEDLAEVSTRQGVRYVLRRNPQRAEDMMATRRSKLASVGRLVEEQNRYLSEHPRAKAPTALNKVTARLEGLRLNGWVRATVQERKVTVEEDATALAEVSKLDGCYVLQTDVGAEWAGKETLHARYKDLTLVEQGFRTSKTVHLEARPVYVRLGTRTRGHVLVVMLAYLIVQELARCWVEFNLTVEEGLKALAGLCATDVLVKGQVCCHQIPEPRASLQELLTAAAVRLPEVVPSQAVTVTTKRTLPERRLKH
jgi:transposase